MSIEEKRREIFEKAFIAEAKADYLAPMIVRGMAQDTAEIIVRHMALERDESGQYKAVVPREQWAGFNLALDALVVELPGDHGPVGALYADGVDVCRRAIEAAGLKVKP